MGLDVWILTGDQIPHVVSDQVQVGFEGYPAEGWFVSVEGYYRAFDGVVTTNLADNPNDDGDDFLPGTGVSWGTDFFLRHTGEDTSGWLAVSFLRARRTFPDFLSGLDPAPDLTYPPIFDRRVDVDLVLQRDLGRGFQAGLRWNFGTGLPYTRPLGSYRYLSQPIMPGSGLQWDPDTDDEGAGAQGGYGVVLSERNGARYPARHRLDVSLRWTVERELGADGSLPEHSERLQPEECPLLLLRVRAGSLRSGRGFPCFHFFRPWVWRCRFDGETPISDLEASSFRRFWPRFCFGSWWV